MKKSENLEAVYIYIYIKRFNKVKLEKHRKYNKAMYFRKI